MDQSFIIGISIGMAVLIFIVIHSWVHKQLKFKMDESTILKCLQELRENGEKCSAEAISVSTQIDVERVNAVCFQSKLTERLADGADLWRLK